MTQKKRVGTGDINVGAFVSNLHEECSELWTAYRASSLNELCDKAEKMKEHGIEPLTCAEEELADILIRTLDTCAAFNIDIGRAVKAKMAYNRTRPYRNGNKIV